MPYSLDLRKRAVSAVHAGMKKVTVCEVFSICKQTLSNWLKLSEKSNDLRPITGFQKGHSHGIKDLDAFREFVNNHPDYTQEEMAKHFSVGSSTISRTLIKIGYSRKKRAKPIQKETIKYEFPVIRPMVTEYQIYAGDCNQCNKNSLGKLPTGVSWSMLGQRATAMTANLSGTYRISKNNIVCMYRDIFDFDLSVGMICKAEKTVSHALEAPVNQANIFIKSSDNVGINADETGFKEKGRRMWAWIATSCFVAVFIIRKNRNKSIAKELLGENFKGILCSDRYSAYQCIPNEKRQLCWAHLERDFRKISERTESSGIIGADLLVQTNNLFHFWHQFKNGDIDRNTLKKKTKSIRIFIEGLLRRGKRSKHNKTSGTSRNILSYGSALWSFMEFFGNR